MRASHQCFSLITQFEGFEEWAYPDPASPLASKTRGKPWGKMNATTILASLPAEVQALSGSPWTIGSGHTRLDNGSVRPEYRITREQDRQELARAVVEYEHAVELATHTNPPNQNQFDALVCCAWNIGTGKRQDGTYSGGIYTSSMVKAHNRGDYQAAARAFALWNKAGGKVWPGLTRRRAAEAALYLKPVPGAMQRIVEAAIPAAHAGGVPEEHDMPQAVEPERPMSASTINRAGVIAGGTAAVATVAETVNTVSSVKYGVESLGDWMVPVLLLAVVGLCAYIVWERVRQRREGWA